MGVSLADADFDEDHEFSESHEINVTPFIDVILVLLIIFMVAAPLSTVDLPIDLPSSTATPQKKPDKPTYVPPCVVPPPPAPPQKKPEKPTYVSIKPDLTLAIGETAVKRIDLLNA